MMLFLMAILFGGTAGNGHIIRSSTQNMQGHDAELDQLRLQVARLSAELIACRTACDACKGGDIEQITRAKSPAVHLTPTPVYARPNVKARVHSPRVSKIANGSIPIRYSRMLLQSGDESDADAKKNSCEPALIDALDPLLRDSIHSKQESLAGKGGTLDMVTFQCDNSSDTCADGTMTWKCEGAIRLQV